MIVGKFVDCTYATKDAAMKGMDDPFREGEWRKGGSL